MYIYNIHPEKDFMYRNRVKTALNTTFIVRLTQEPARNSNIQ